MMQWIASHPLLFIYASAALGAALLVEAVYLVVADVLGRKRALNHRLRATGSLPDRKAALQLLRRERGLDAAGRFLLPVHGFNRLIMQSGTRLGAWRMLIVMAMSGTGAAVLAGLPTGRSWLALLAFIIAGVLLPLLVLLAMRSRRRQAFARQLPDALDIMVRSLRAGHPVPVAISALAQQMPDPVGTEFGIASDEITYGSDLQTAMVSLSERVGQADLPLLAAAISLQSATGGNLADVLRNLSSILRERFKMARKIRALSAEGRFSAIGLSIMPVLLFGVLNLLAPSYYGKVWNDPLVWPALGGAAALLIIGNLLMLKIVNFKY